MASSPTEQQRFESFDGTAIAWREIGEGRPVMLLHGLFSNAWTNWIRYGNAAIIAARGFRVIMPDHRGHGDSARPHDAAAYPKDVLARDAMALIAHLGLVDHDLGGYSLGARTAARMLVLGASPQRVILGGMGLAGLTSTGGRSDHFRHVLENLGKHPRNSPEWMAEAFLQTVTGDPEALIHVLDTFVDTPLSALAAIEQPVLVLSGREDGDNGSAADLAAALPHGVLREIPGGHMSAVLKHDLGEAIADFLTG